MREVKVHVRVLPQEMGNGRRDREFLGRIIGAPTVVGGGGAGETKRGERQPK